MIDAFRFAGGKCDLVAESSVKKFRFYAYSGGVMHPKLAINWRGPVVVDVSNMQVPRDEIPVHVDHDISRPVGHTVIVTCDNEILAEGIFSVGSDDSQMVQSSAELGFPWKCSIGLKIEDYQTIDEGRSVTVNGRDFAGPILVVTSSVLEEISFVTVPGDKESYAEVMARLSNGEASMPTFEEWVASLGLDPAALSDAAKMALQVAYAEQAEEMTPDPEVQPEEMDAEDMEEKKDMEAEYTEEKKDMAASSNRKRAATSKRVSDLRATAAKEAARVHGITKLCLGYGNPEVSVAGKNVSLAAHAISQGWDMERTELTYLKQQRLQAKRDDRPQGPAIHSKSSGSVSVATLQAAALLRAGADLESNKWSGKNFREALKMDWLKAGINSDAKQQILESAHRFRNCSMIELAAHALRVTGREVPTDRMDMLQATFSTGAFSDLYGQTIGAKVLEGYNEIRDFSAGWTSESENPDLKEHDRIRMQAAADLEYLPIGGEAAHAKRQTQTESIRVERFAKQMEIDEADLLGDNFNKLSDTPRDFGLAAARVRPNLVASIILDNPTLTATGRDLFNTTDGNKKGSSALSRTSLSAAIAAMSKFKDGDATLNIAPTHILVPPDLMDLAIQLTQSTRNATTGSNEGEINPLAAYGLTPISEARLANGVIDPVSGTSYAGSTSTWYLISREAHTIEVVFLQGAGRAPQVRTTQLVNGRFGLNIDVRHYVGAKALDWRGFVYNQSASL